MWKNIPNYSSYEASDTGLVRRIISNQILKPFVMSNGYFALSITNDNCINKTELIHRIVLLTFTGSCPDGL